MGLMATALLQIFALQIHKEHVVCQEQFQMMQSMLELMLSLLQSMKHQTRKQ